MKEPQQHSVGAGQSVAETLDTIAEGVKVATEVMKLINLLTGGFGGAPACMPNYNHLLGLQGFGIGYDPSALLASMGFGIGYDPSTLLASMGFGVDYNALLGNSFGIGFGSFNGFSW